MRSHSRPTHAMSRFGCIACPAVCATVTALARLTLFCGHHQAQGSLCHRIQGMVPSALLSKNPSGQAMRRRSFSVTSSSVYALSAHACSVSLGLHRVPCGLCSRDCTRSNYTTTVQLVPSRASHALTAYRILFNLNIQHNCNHNKHTTMPCRLRV